MTTNELTLPESQKSTRRSKIALLGLTVTGGLAVGVTVVTASFVSPALRRICLPYVPATQKQITNVLKLCRKERGRSTLVDLGSGDGRIVFAAARNGYQATGYELNTWLVLYSKISSKINGLSTRTHFERKNLWKADMRRFDNVVIFGVADMMDELSFKLEKEIQTNTRVVACRFPIKRWNAEKVIEDGIDSAWLYTRESLNSVKKGNE